MVFKKTFSFFITFWKFVQSLYIYTCVCSSVTSSLIDQASFWFRIYYLLFDLKNNFLGQMQRKMFPHSLTNENCDINICAVT